MSNTTTSLKDPQDYKWCEHCQKTDHNDAECWSTRAVSPADKVGLWRVGRNPPLNIVYITTPVQFKAMVRRLQLNKQSTQYKTGS